MRTVTFDYDRPETLAAALDGVDTVLLISGTELGRRVPQHTAVIEAAKAAGVTKLAYTSMPLATTTSLVLAPEHKATEEAIAAAGLPAVILRNNWYSELQADNLAQARQTGVLIGSAGEGRIASASRLDFADAAAAVLLEEGHVGQVYELAGDVAWTQDDLAAVIGAVVGREVVYQNVTPAERRAGLLAVGLDTFVADILVGIDAGVAAGELAFTDGTLARIIGRPTTPLIDTLRASA